MASFITMGGARAGSGQVEYSIDHNVQGYSYQASYAQDAGSISAPCTAPALYIMGLMYPSTKTIQDISWGGIVLEERTVNLSANETLRLALVVSSNGSPVVSYSGGYSVPVVFAYYLAPYTSNINYQQLYNNDELKYTLDDIEYSYANSVSKSSSPATISLGNAGKYHIIAITAINNTGAGHVHNLSANNGTVESFREYFFALNNRHSGMSVGIIDGENNCKAVFYATAGSYDGHQLIMWIKKKS